MFKMKILYFLCVLVVGVLVDVVLSQGLLSRAESLKAADTNYSFPFHNRSAWGAREPLETINLTTPVPYVVIHDSGEPPAIEVGGCFNFTACSQSMKNIQDMHMDANGWWDIGYNFAVGGDGAAYEGRGWDILGAHVKYFNSLSIGIAYIGSFTSKVPTLQQDYAAKKLIEAGVEKGYIRPDYRLINHGQIRGKACPGKKLAKKVRANPHFSAFPSSLRDLLDIPELPEETKEEIRREISTIVATVVGF